MRRLRPSSVARPCTAPSVAFTICEPGAARWTAGGSVLTHVAIASDARVRALSADGSTAVGEVGGEAFAWTAELSQLLFKGEEAAAGMKAFLHRTKPPWAADNE